MKQQRKQIPIIAYIILLGIIIYMGHNSINTIIEQQKQTNRRLLQIEAAQQAVNVRVGLRSEQINNYEQQIRKADTNFSALQGTDCIRCHLQPELLLPIENKEILTLQAFTQIIRKGIKDKMPKYSKNPNDLQNSITDKEIQRIYKILMK